MTSSNTTDPSPLLGTKEEDNVPHVLLSLEEDKVPAFTSHYTQIRRYFKLFGYPLKVLFGNVISFVLVQSLVLPWYNNGGYRPGYLHGGSGSFYENAQFKTMLSAGLAISLMTWVVDGHICLHGARTMEAKANSKGTSDVDTEGTAANPAATNKEEEETHQELLKLSRRVDAAFGFSSSTFVVGLLYALFTLAVWQAVQSGTSLLQVQILPAQDLPEKGRCFVTGNFAYDGPFEGEEEEEGIASLKKSDGFEDLPAGVQKWINQQPADQHHVVHALGHGGEANKAAGRKPYLPMLDGSLVFTKAVGDRFSRRGSDNKDRQAGIAVYSPEDKTVQEYVSTPPKGRNARRDEGEVELIGFPGQGPYSGWCGVFKAYGNNVMEDEVLCYNTNTTKMQRFEAISDKGSRWHGWDSGVYSFYATDDTLWTANKRGFYRPSFRSYEDSRINVVTLISYNIQTMEKHVSLKRNATDNSGTLIYHHRAVSKNCRTYYWINIVVGLLALGLLSSYLYRLDVPSCSLPAATALSLLMNAIVEPAGAGMTLLAVACGCLFLLVAVRRSSMVWKYVSTEMVIWALYSLQLASNWYFWSQSAWDDMLFEGQVLMSTLPFPLVSFLVAAATTVLLDHPYFQVLAVCLGGLSLLSVVFVLAGLNFLLFPVILLALALGCFRAGTLLQMYRVHVVVYAGRSCRKCTGFFKTAYHGAATRP